MWSSWSACPTVRKACIETINTSPVLRLRDRLLPLVSLRAVLGLEPGGPAKDRFVIVAQVGANTFGVIVDRVFDTEEIVVKPVAPMLRGTRFYVGNTILGDGSVIMILDPNGLSGVAGQIDAADPSSAQGKAAHGDAQGDGQASFLLFRAGGCELKAIPLELVSRIEEPGSGDDRACRRPTGGSVSRSPDAVGALRRCPPVER